jgi:hypothetical protein
MTDKQKQVYSDILDSQVLSENIHGLLKKYKEDNREIIKLSGNKGDLIENLFEAVENNIIELHEIQNLIKDSEEFGDQYIYLFSIIDSKSANKYNDGKQIGNAIIPASVSRNFPKIMKNPSNLEWVDFRFPNRGLENSWLVKLYDKKTREVKENERIDASNGLRHVTYRKKEARLVYIAQWDGDEELSLKISRTSFDSYKSLWKSRKQLTDLLNKGVDLQRDFTKTDLSDTINNILINSETSRNIYILMSAKLTDSHNGSATISTYGEDELDLLSDVSRREAINAYLRGNGKARSLVVKFLAEGSDNVLTKDITVVLGRHDINEMIISSKISPQEYKYVRRKIEDFS